MNMIGTHFNDLYIFFRKAVFVFCLYLLWSCDRSPYSNILEQTPHNIGISMLCGSVHLYLFLSLKRPPYYFVVAVGRPQLHHNLEDFYLKLKFFILTSMSDGFLTLMLTTRKKQVAFEMPPAFFPICFSTSPNNRHCHLTAPFLSTGHVLLQKEWPALRSGSAGKSVPHN